MAFERAGRMEIVAIRIIVGLLAVIALDAGRAKAQDGDELSGGQLTAEYCSQCHGLKQVFRAEYDRAQWAEAIARMEEQGLYVEDEERQAIIEFLLEQRAEKSLLELMGTHHFVLLHFPIVLLVLVALFEGVAAWNRERPEADHVHLLMRLAVVSMAIVIPLGFALIYERETISPLIELHRNLGLAAGALTLVALVLREVAVRREPGNLVWVYRGLLLVAVVLVALTADRGGALVHGDLVRDIEDFLAG